MGFVLDMLRRIHVNIGNLINVGVGFNLEISKGKTVVIVEFALGLRVHRVTVEHGFADVHTFRSKGDIVTVGAGAHGKEVAASCHEIADAFGYSEFHLRHFCESQLRGAFLIFAHIVLIPFGIAVIRPEFTILAGEVLVVEVQPVVFGKFTFDDLFVINHSVGYLGVGEHKGDGIVPRKFVFGRIDSNFRLFSEPYFVHVVLDHSNFVENLCGLKVSENFIGNSAYQAFVLHTSVIWAHETAATVVQQPTHVNLMGNGEIGDSVCFQMVTLCQIHGNQQITGSADCHAKDDSQKQNCFFHRFKN